MNLPTNLKLTAKIFHHSFFLVLLTLFLVSFVFSFLGKTSHFVLFFDLLILLSLCFFRINKSNLLLLGLVVLYLFYNISYVLYSYGFHYLRDLFISIKFLIYFAILLCINRDEIISKVALNKIVNLLLVLFFIKYAVMRGLGDPRPSLFTENNFELCFLSILYVVNVYSGYSSRLKFILLVAIILISGSRSAVLGLFLIYMFEYRPLKGSFSSLFIKLFVLCILLGVLGFVIMGRMTSGGLEEVDRYIFLIAFIQTVSQWGLPEILFGASPLTPLTAEICQRLNFYQSLFSSANPDVCYPVILHLFWLRVILEHGILLTLIFVFGIFKVLRSKGLNVRVSLYVLALLGVNGLSVSSFNSSIIFMAIILISLMHKYYPHKNNLYKEAYSVQNVQ